MDGPVVRWKNKMKKERRQPAAGARTYVEMTSRVKCSRSPTLWIEPCIVYGGKLNWLLLLASVPRMWNSAKPAPGHFPSGSPWLRAGSLNASNNQCTAKARTWDLFLYLYYSQYVFASFFIIIIITIMMIIIMIRFLFGLNPSVRCWSGCLRIVNDVKIVHGFVHRLL